MKIYKEQILFSGALFSGWGILLIVLREVLFKESISNMGEISFVIGVVLIIISLRFGTKNKEVIKFNDEEKKK